MQARKEAILSIFNRLAPDESTIVKFDHNMKPLTGPVVKYEVIGCESTGPTLTIVNHDEYDSDIYLQAVNQPPPGWEEVFHEGAHEIQDVWNYIQAKGEYLPTPENVYQIFRILRPQDIRVVIVGQDPYHQVYTTGPRATGMAFSQHRWDRVSVSLTNIYKEIKSTYPDTFKVPNHGDLTAWARQGIFLLNACLTVCPGQAGSHGNIWIGFINRVLKHIVEVNPKVIFVLWGSKAQKLCDILGSRVTQICSSHPSGYSAYRGFFGSQFPKKIDTILVEELGQSPIDWNLE